MRAEKTLFVWRGEISRGGSSGWDPDSTTHYGPTKLPSIYDDCRKQCPFCKIAYTHTHSEDIGRPFSGPRECRICGFACSYDSGDYYGEGSNADYWSESISTIKELSFSSSEITFPELASHLKRKPEDYFSLSPRRFEELIADVYRNLGYEVELTQQTCDGGIDILLLNNRQEQEIVQCKRYAKTRAVTIAAVREILGVAIFAGADRASIVTTSRFTRPAVALAEAVRDRLSRFTIDLLSASDLVNAIGAYDTQLPPLHLNPMLDELRRLQQA